MCDHTPWFLSLGSQGQATLLTLSKSLAEGGFEPLAVELSGKDPVIERAIRTSNIRKRSQVSIDEYAATEINTTPRLDMITSSYFIPELDFLC